jgi:hypothetical protein
MFDEVQIYLARGLKKRHTYFVQEKLSGFWDSTRKGRSV